MNSFTEIKKRRSQSFSGMDRQRKRESTKYVSEIFGIVLLLNALEEHGLIRITVVSVGNAPVLVLKA